MSVNYNPATPTDGLVLCLDTANSRSYPGSGTTWFDISGQGNNGTLTNGPTLNTGLGGGISFDGVNDFIDIADSQTLSFGTADFTISGWFFVTTLAGNGTRFFSENNPGSNQSQFWFRQETGGGAVRFLTESATGFTSIQSADGAIVANQWIHFITRRLGTELAIYKNGVLLASTTGTVRNVSSAQNLVIGKQSTGYLIGRADDVRAYNRALSPSEIYQLFSSKRGRFNV